MAVCRILGKTEMCYRGVPFDFGSEELRDRYRDKIEEAERQRNLSRILYLIEQMEISASRKDRLQEPAGSFASRTFRRHKGEKASQPASRKNRSGTSASLRTSAADTPAENSEDEVPFDVPDAPEFKDPDVYVPM